MDLLIEAFIDDYFTSDLADAIRNSFEIMDAFGYDYNEQDFIRILMEGENQYSFYLQDAFLVMLNNKLDSVLKEHTIVLNNASIYQKNEILSALYTVQNLNDYSSILYLLESDLNPDEKLAEVIAQLSTLTPSQVISLIEDYDERIVDTLKQYIYEYYPDQYTEAKNNDENKAIITNYKKFYQFIIDNNIELPLGVDYFEAGLLPGLEFSSYLHYFNELTDNKDIKKLALDILSIILLSKDGFTNPIQCYRNNSSLIFSELDIITKVDANLTDYINKFETYKQAISVPSPEPIIKDNKNG